MDTMMRFGWAASAMGVTLVAGAAALGASGGEQPGALADRARTVMTQSPLVDGHNDLPWAMRERARYDLDKVDIRQPQPALMTDIPRLRKGQVGAQFWSVYVPASLPGDRAVSATLEQVDFVHQLVRRYPDTFEIASTSADVERIFRSGRVASMMGVEGGHSIDSSLATLRMLHRLGARYMTLTHSSNVPWADSGTDKPLNGGLSPFGEAVVREMNWLGMLVDLSHVSPEAMDDALRVSRAPVVFSHSSARALCDVARNVPDDVLKRLPQNGGVVMVTFVPSFLSPAAADWDRQSAAEFERARKRFPKDEAAIRAAVDAWRAAHPEPTATLGDVADHIDHVRKVAGIDHVGIGSDFDGISSAPIGLEDVSTFPALVEELLRRGYSDEDVKKVLGLNVIRAMRRAEQVAQAMQSERGPSNATIEQLDGRRAGEAMVR
jgi:membrane dipeptidase